MAKVIAVDFDGTLCERNFPDIGAPIMSVIEYVKRKKEQGDTLILWTCRVGRRLTEAVEWCKQYGLVFDYINESAPEMVERYGGDTRKISADEYIDDKMTSPNFIRFMEVLTMTAKQTKDIAKATAADICESLNEFCASNLAEKERELVTAKLHEIGERYGVERKNLDSLSWAEIAEIAESGKADTYFKVGDAKNITLYTGERVALVILGFNHDTLSENGAAADKTAGITFGLKDMLDGEYEINEQCTNVGGWRKSKMRNVYMPRFLSLLPAELREVIKPVVKLTGKGSGSEEVEPTDDKLFLLSQVEVFGDSRYTADGEGAQYAYFKNGENVIKRRGGSASTWWLRSPYVSNTTYFRYVTSTGIVLGSLANFSCGVSFGFCV